MAYFSNGTQGMDYQLHYCERCRNYRDLDDGRGPGCPVWDLHIVHNMSSDETVKSILDTLIPVQGGGGRYPTECAMFLESPEIFPGTRLALESLCNVGGKE